MLMRSKTFHNIYSENSISCHWIQIKPVESWVSTGSAYNPYLYKYWAKLYLRLAQMYKIYFVRFKMQLADTYGYLFVAWRTIQKLKWEIHICLCIDFREETHHKSKKFQINCFAFLLPKFLSKMQLLLRKDSTFPRSYIGAYTVSNNILQTQLNKFTTGIQWNKQQQYVPKVITITRKIHNIRWT